jgi:hypothetical protein
MNGLFVAVVTVPGLFEGPDTFRFTASGIILAILSKANSGTLATAR